MEGGSALVSSDFEWVGRSLASRKTSIFMRFAHAIDEGHQKSSTFDGCKRKQEPREEYARRKVPLPSDERDELRLRLDMQELRKYFAKVDDFALMVKSPSPPWKRLRVNVDEGVPSTLPLNSEMFPSGCTSPAGSGGEEKGLRSAMFNIPESKEQFKSDVGSKHNELGNPADGGPPGRTNKSKDEWLSRGKLDRKSSETASKLDLDKDRGGYGTTTVQERLFIPDLPGSMDKLRVVSPDLGRLNSDKDRWRALGDQVQSLSSRDIGSLQEIPGKLNDLGEAVRKHSIVDRCVDENRIPENIQDEDNHQEGRYETRQGRRKSLLETVVLGQHVATMQRLLQGCKQQVNGTFLPDMRSVLEQFVDLKKIEKIGEGTFGEAFKCDDLVVKIVPIEGEQLVNGCPQKKADEVLGEVVISLMLSDLRLQEVSNSNNYTDGLAFTHAVRICRGRYCSELLQEWNRWHAVMGSDNDSVEGLPDDQLFLIFVLENAGLDLEKFELRNFGEARSMLLQSILALSVGEEALQFEHRDLHWGNVLIHRTPENQTSAVLRNQKIHVANHGIKVVLIDFTLSRLGHGNGAAAYCDLTLDPDIFNGPKRDCQAETYRRMRTAVKDNWAEFCPRTNVLWIHYLADTLLNLKKIPMSDSERRQLRGFRIRSIRATCCSDLIFDPLFSSMWHVHSAE